MIDQKVIDGLKELYEFIEKKNGFLLHKTTEKGAAEILFLMEDKILCCYRIRDSKGNVVKEDYREFEKKYKGIFYLKRMAFAHVYHYLH